VTKFDDLIYFQQITPYQGSKSASGQGCFGNIYPVSRGLVGQAAVSGFPLLMRNTDKKDYDDLQNILGLDKQREEAKKPASYLAIPILAPNITGELATNLILYVEANDTTFFNKNEALEAIMSGLSGLISYIELMLKENIIAMHELEYEPTPKNGLITFEIESNNCFERLDTSAPTLFPVKYPLKFEEFHSFDIIYNR
jgi:hypothetical protein